MNRFLEKYEFWIDAFFIATAWGNFWKSFSHVPGNIGFDWLYALVFVFVVALTAIRRRMDKLHAEGIGVA